MSILVHRHGILGGAAAAPDLAFSITREALDTGTGTQDITVSGLGTPKAARVFVTSAVANDTLAAHSYLSVGATDGTNQWVSSGSDQDAVGTENALYIGNTSNVIGVRGFSSAYLIEASATLITDGIRLNITTNDDSQPFVTVVFYAGSALSAWAGTTAFTTDTNSVTLTPGFQANAIFAQSHAGAFNNTEAARMYTKCGYCSYDGSTIRQIALDRTRYDASGTMRIDTKQVAGFIFHTLSATGGTFIENITSTQFDITSSGADFSASYIGLLALNFGGAGEAWAGACTGPTTTGSHTFSEPNFEPTISEFALSRITANNTLYSDNTGSTIGYAIFTAGEGYTNLVVNDDGSTNSEAESLSVADSFHLIGQDDTDELIGTLTSMGSTGPVFNFTTTLTGSLLLPSMHIKIN